MPVRLTRAIEFSASLRYWNESLSDEENERVFGHSTKQHGHNYRLEVTLSGEPDPKTGMVINLTELKAILEREVMARFDHKDLNRDMDYFKVKPPTPENVAAQIHAFLIAALPPGLFDRLRLYQDEDHYVDIIGSEVAGETS